jgi:Flp pilus assembly protein TadB
LLAFVHELAGTRRDPLAQTRRQDCAQHRPRVPGSLPERRKNLREDVDDIQRDTDRKRPAKIGWRMPVMPMIMMTMSMGLFLIIVVVLVMMMAMIGLTGGLVP